MEEDKDQDSKTEDPTEKRIEESFEQGQVASSKEIINFALFLSLLLVCYFLWPNLLETFYVFLKNTFEEAFETKVNSKNISHILTNVINKGLVYVFLPIIFVVIAMIISIFAQHGRIIFTIEPIIPNLSRISPMSGFGRIFSTKSLVEFLKSLLKVSIVSFVLYLTLKGKLTNLYVISEFPLGMIIKSLKDIADEVLLKTTIVVGAIGALDFFYQKYEHYESLKMTKEEIKQEAKQTEPNPEVKKQQRQRHIKRTKGKVQDLVPTADVVITNPTHYSIALKYDPDTMMAPIIVAKGVDFMALKIREIAKEHDIILIQNPPLARSLYDDSEVGEQIEPKHYKAVAEIITYVFKLKKKQKK